MVTDQLRDRALAPDGGDGLECVGREPTVPLAPVPGTTQSGRSSRALGLLGFAGPLTAAAVTVVVEAMHGGPLAVGAVVFVALLAVRALGDWEPEWSHALPLMGSLVRLMMLCRSAVVVGVLHLAGVLSAVEGGYVALIAGGAVVADALAARVRHALVRKPALRVAVIGSARVAKSLDREMRLAGLLDRYEVVGRIIGPEEAWSEASEVPVIGRVGELAEAVASQRLDLLLMSSKVPRMAIFEEVARTCLHLPVRMHELSSFYERVFCHVAATEINAAWFQYILHPKYQADATRAERALDLVVTAVVAVFVLPLLGILALLVRRDGGPVFFRQTRIGEGGRPFTMYKLRTMRVDNADASWANEGDARVTPIGRFLRRTHLDELPQLLNVLRGDMSIVGPRPEQPQIVDELELLMPFYQRRHLIKPGVTGWAQIRCGYAGSHAGSAWKLCHDLYYLRHRSVWLNVVIIVETLRTLIADQQYTASPLSVDFILAPAHPLPDVAHATP